MGKKIQIYFMSLGFFFVLLMMKSIYIQIYFGKDSHFVGWKNLFLNNIVSIGCLLLLFVVYICKKNFDKEIEGCKDLPCILVDLENKNENYIVFLTTYIIPLLDWDFSSIRSILILITIIVLNGWLLIKTNLYYQNPMLALMGYNVYWAEISRKDNDGKQVILISKDKLERNAQIQAHELEDGVLLANIFNNR